MIRIEAIDIHDARHKLGLSAPSCPIKIRWRSHEQFYDYGRIHEPGCIIDAVGMPGEETQRSFTNSWEAAKHIHKLLKMHDKHSREQRRKHNKELKTRIKAKP